MEEVRNFVFILLLVVLSSASTSSQEVTDKEVADIVLRTVDDVCSTIDECKLECCALNRIYAIAHTNCSNSTDIDEQLAEVKWNSLFSADHKLSCDSHCSGKVNNETMMEEEDFKIFMDNVTSDLYYFCHNFVDVCYDYSLRGMHFDHLGTMDPIRRFWLPFLGLVLSMTLMSLTLILYLAVPELCRRVQDKCFLFHLSFRIMFSIMYIIVLFSPLDRESVSCKLYAFLYQFSELSAAFWLNIICYHLWLCIKSPITHIAQQSSTKRIRYYFFYACGCSFLATIITISADWLPDKFDLYKPHIGRERCKIVGYEDYIGASMWLQPKFIYNYSIQIIIQIINLVAFLHIVYILRTETGQVRSNKMQQLSLLTYVKLFLLMGLTTILDIIIFHAGQSAIQKLFPTFVSAALLFVIFVCTDNERVFRLVKKRFLQLTSQSSVHSSRTGYKQNLQSTPLTQLE